MRLSKNIFFLLGFFILAGCADAPVIDFKESYIDTRAAVAQKFRFDKPSLWGRSIPGVKTRLKTDDQVVALTLNACGTEPDGFDEFLINFLRAEKIPATIFVSVPWIEKYRAQFNRLSIDPLFEIANHGLSHRSGSINGRASEGIAGAQNLESWIDEVGLAGQKIKFMTGKMPVYFRSGSGYYDDVALKVVNYLGYEAIGFSLSADEGATLYSYEIYRKVLSSVKAGDIIQAQMNHPEKETAQGLIPAIRKLKKQGFRFVSLSDYPLE